MIHRGHGFLDRGFRVGAMAQEEVEIVHPQPTQRPIAGITQVFAREPALGRARIRHRPEEGLAAQADRIARQAQVRDEIAKPGLGHSPGVVFSGVEQVDPGIEGARHEASCAAAIQDTGERDPGAQREGRDLEPAIAQTAVFHFRVRMFHARSVPGRGPLQFSGA